MAYISSGRVRPLALTTAKRGFIEVPTMIESGFVGFDLSTWLGFLGPAGMSPAIVNKLNTDLIAVMKSPQISEKIKQQGMLEVASTPTDFAEKIVKDVQMYKGIIQKSGAKTD
jgi:tripartite-type tricarboxylate transporter receptor subunit TctC